MLTGLSIRDVVLIEALDLEFARGLGVLTGETGAGKSILLDALGLALGGRGDSALVRARRGAGERHRHVRRRPPRVRDLLDANGIAIEPGEPLIMRRIVKADGGSRGVRQRPAGVGAGCCASWRRTWSRSTASTTTAACSTRAATARCSTPSAASTRATAAQGLARRGATAEAALADARAEIEAAARDRDWLEHAVAELIALAPMPARRSRSSPTAAARCSKREKLADDLAMVDSASRKARTAALSQLRQAARMLDRIGGRPRGAGGRARRDRPRGDRGRRSPRTGCARHAPRWRTTRTQLEDDEARLFELRAMARKHRVQPDDLGALSADLRATSGAARCRRRRGGATGGPAVAAREAYDKTAAAVTEARHAAAARLDAAVAGELAPLKLDAARFRTVVAPMPEDGWSAIGRDRVEFEISTNPGAPFGALIQASPAAASCRASSWR